MVTPLPKIMALPDDLAGDLEAVAYTDGHSVEVALEVAVRVYIRSRLADPSFRETIMAIADELDLPGQLHCTAPELRRMRRRHHELLPRSRNRRR